MKIFKILKSPVAILIFIILSLIIGAFLNPLTIPIYIVWYLIIYFFYKQSSRGDSDNLKERFLLYFYLFPIFETSIYLVLLLDLPFLRGKALNIFEHFNGAFFITLSLFTFINHKLIDAKIPFIVEVLLVLGIVNLFGVFNEFWEYGLRAFSQTEICSLKLCKDMLRYDIEEYYTDTIKDLAVNLLGSIGAIVLKEIRSR